MSADEHGQCRERKGSKRRLMYVTGRENRQIITELGFLYEGVGESAAAWHSGQDGTTNTFLSGFWYLVRKTVSCLESYCTPGSMYRTLLEQRQPINTRRFAVRIYRLCERGDLITLMHFRTDAGWGTLRGFKLSKSFVSKRATR